MDHTQGHGWGAAKEADACTVGSGGFRALLGLCPLTDPHEAALLGCLQGSPLWGLHTLAPQVWVSQAFSPTNCILSRFPNCSSKTLSSPRPDVLKAFKVPSAW